MENDDISEELDYYTSAGSTYKAMIESFKLDLSSIPKEEVDEILKVRQVEPVKSRGKTKKLSVQEKEEEEKATADNEPSAPRRTRQRGRKPKSNETAEETQEKRRELADSPICIPDSPTDLHISRPRRTTRRGRKRKSNETAEETQEKERQLADSPICIPDSPTDLHICPEKANTVNDVLCISSDEEEDLNHIANISVTEEEENYEVSVKVSWRFSRIDKFNIRRFQKLACLFEHYSKLENVDKDQILFTLNDAVIHPDDSPDSIKLSVADFIEGGLMSRQKAQETAPAINKDEIQLKVLLKGAKHPLTVQILKSQKMKILKIKCAESLELPIEKLKFIFDGEVLDSNETPDSLDLEGGECIDVHILD